MDYSFSRIEGYWKEKWKEEKIYLVSNASSKPKYYVLDMFPYPSGAGLHVGHPLGYIASDIFSRYKRLKGFNVLHPMGFDSFGLPAEQYALETGQHPAETTKKNIATFKSQLDIIGFCYDWEREVQTSNPSYYKWTQWIFLLLFNSYYCKQENKAKPIHFLIEEFENKGSDSFTSSNWKSYSPAQQADILMQFRLAYSAYGEVNWCEALGTVLANDEVVNGLSERGGHPVIKKKMRQWFLRITAYANRLLEGLEKVDFSDSMKEMQRNWIGRSQGAEMEFEVEGTNQKILVYTTRPDTIFGVDFLVLAPEHILVKDIIAPSERKSIEAYLAYVKSRSDRERMAEVKQITGCFTGTYAYNPLSGKKVPVWIAEYVLLGYGTGAIMAVPCGDQRDFLFAKHFNIPVTNIIGSQFNGEEANPTKDAILQNSGFLNGLPMHEAISIAIKKIESSGIGNRKVNFRMRDAGFSRQRYWGEPFPIIWKDSEALPLSETLLPLELPHAGKYSPGPDGEGPLANLTDWVNTPKGKRETSTMPGYAGSSWYFLRYMDPHNQQEFCSREASDYWNQVDVYIGGTEHAVGHLLYSRMWTKFLFDRGLIGFDEPFKKLVNQGMIQGSSRFVYRIEGTNQFVSNGLKEGYKVNPLHVDVNMVNGYELDTEAFKKWRPDFETATFILEEGKYICGSETEKMSKTKFNTVNPNDLVLKYGADTFRMYEMFLGPIEQSKPWDAKGIEGVHRFLRKLWRLFYDEQKGTALFTSATPTETELKCLHRSIKKIEDDTERFSFNTAVSSFMILVNDLTDLKCHKKTILESVLIMLSPYAPHISEELWHKLGNEGSVLNAAYPVADQKYLTDSSKEYPLSVNGKLRTTLVLPLDADQAFVEKEVLANETVIKWLEGKQMKKLIYVKGKMINVVI